eukprot:361794-Chlamydomonas_euryale.AAC.3
MRQTYIAHSRAAGGAAAEAWRRDKGALAAILSERGRVFLRMPPSVLCSSRKLFIETRLASAGARIKRVRSRASKQRAPYAADRAKRVAVRGGARAPPSLILLRRAMMPTSAGAVPRGGCSFDTPATAMPRCFSLSGVALRRHPHRDMLNAAAKKIRALAGDLRVSNGRAGRSRPDRTLMLARKRFQRDRVHVGVDAWAAGVIIASARTCPCFDIEHSP